MRINEVARWWKTPSKSRPFREVAYGRILVSGWLPATLGDKIVSRLATDWTLNAGFPLPPEADPRVPPTKVCSLVPGSLREPMDNYASIVGLSRGAVVRIALAEFFIRRGLGDER